MYCCEYLLILVVRTSLFLNRLVQILEINYNNRDHKKKKEKKMPKTQYT